MLESLPEIVRVLVNMRIFLTARPNVDDEVMECFGKVVRVSLSPAEDEIQGYYIWRWGWITGRILIPMQ